MRLRSRPPTLGRSQRVELRPFQRADLEQVQGWEPYEEVLFQQYNMPRGTPRQNDAWFEHNIRRGERLYFTVTRLGDGAVIGLISLREVYRSPRRASARLGIVFGAAFAGQGYGSEALPLFLTHLFGPLGFSLLKLDVAAFNGRALRLYEKCGFRRVGSFYRSAAGQRLAPEALEDDGEPPFFVHWHEATYVLHYEMELTEKAWRERSGERP
ncbi:MAG: GNAT family N-acetyltransferase [Chloroflexi bacterium]|nr:GNAT family N-acetyltransferase [Chloroflexota bacterium]